MRDRDRANNNEIEILVFSVTSNDFPHDMLVPHFFIENRRYHPLSAVSAVVVDGTGYGPMRRREFLTILGSAALISPATGGTADAFPNRPTRLIKEHRL